LAGPIDSNHLKSGANARCKRLEISASVAYGMKADHRWAAAFARHGQAYSIHHYFRRAEWNTSIEPVFALR
jgi:hypothetical protein